MGSRVTPRASCCPTAGPAPGTEGLEACQVLQVELQALNLEPEQRITYGGEIGSGISATVFEGTLERDGVLLPVAIKRFRQEVKLTLPKSVVDLGRELRILAKISHPNLLHLYGVVPNDPPEFVTELCRGGNAFNLLHVQQDLEISWRQKLKICSDTAAGIGYLHGLSPAILHRDLKSLNLLLVDEFTGEEDGEITIKVCDFGLSRLKEGEEERSLMTKNVGTTNWLAPEVVGVGAVSYNEKVDVYSFSMTMFEVICREVPFEDDDPTGVIRRVKRGERPDLEAVPPDCPEPLQRLMEDCWHAEPSRRPCFDRISRRLEDIQQEL